MNTKKHFLKRIKIELQELLGLISIKELVTNQLLAKRYEKVHFQMLSI